MAAIKSSPVAFRFDPEVKRALAVIADREGRSKANMMEWLIRKHCEREGLGWPLDEVAESAGQTKKTKAISSPKPAKRASKKSITD